MSTLVEEISEKKVETAAVPAATVSEIAPSNNENSRMISKKHASIAPEVDDYFKTEESEDEAKAKPWTSQDKIERDKMVAAVLKATENFFPAASALMTIRDKCLWRETHSSFPDFCRDELDISEARASQMITAAEAYEELSKKLEEALLPRNERAFRALRKIGKLDNQIKVLEFIAENSPGERVTSTSIEQAIASLELGPKKGKTEASQFKFKTALKKVEDLQLYFDKCDPNKMTGEEIKNLRDVFTQVLNILKPTALSTNQGDQ